MRKTILPLIILCGLQLLAGQTNFTIPRDKSFLPKVNTVYYKLGERLIQIRTFQYGDVRDLVYINLHDDEMTAVNGAKKILEKRGGFLIKIDNYRTRNINFKLDGLKYTIDPNRMFSREGIARSLLIFGNTSPKAINEVEKFANRILQLIPPHPAWIIALHNNTNGKYSVNSYLRGGDKEKDAKNVKVNDDMDADDFFLTTDSLLFVRLSGENYNAIWQDNLRAKRDGSLSVYCGERNLQYVNCETEHGRQPEYDQMITLAVNKATGKSTEIIASTKTDTKYTGTALTTKLTVSKKPEAPATSTRPGPRRPAPNSIKLVTEPPAKSNADIIAYRYRINPVSVPFNLKPNTEIFFGERKIGWIISVLPESSNAVSGQFEIDKNFEVYSNMDFILFISSSPRLELHINPTRKKILINPETTTIPVSARITN